MTQAKQRFRTIEEYLGYDDGTDTRYELVNGELVEMPPENPLNRKIASFLFAAFVRLGVSEDLLAIGTQIAVTSSENISARQPDLVVHSSESNAALEGVKSDLITQGMPNPALVIEVVSLGDPGDKNYDREYIHKPKEYATRGIPEFWQIDPSRSVVIVLNLKDGAYQSREFRGSDRVLSPTFPDLQLTAEQILRAGR
ncbi:Uma2 family endonuclease [Phormidesmis priestleyi]|uniref:Uma2 family endonuclease n=1 Tax=Phormidesmis priestleyi TaxID=268141 RepID=UPI00083B8E6D|nr:Uma2 family endonuclease [Phormidesmis priestleyi]